MTRIKVCGNTEPEAVAQAVRQGVDLLGFIFTRSPRRVTPEQAQALVAEVPDSVERVGVFLDEPADVIRPIVAACKLTAVQLYREPQPADRELGVPLIPVVRLRSRVEANALRVAPHDRLLLDTWSQRMTGGTGKTWDWTLAEGLARQHRVIVSGGLRPENVGAAIRQLRPWGVDVCSGIERAPGLKDLARLEWFVRAVRESDASQAREAHSVAG